MKSHAFSLLLAASSVLAAPAESCTAVVKTTSGRYAPVVAESQAKVAAYLDIPYAEDPTGDLRFAPPVAKSYPGDEVVKATSLPAGCFQYLAPNFQGGIFDVVKGGVLQNGDFSNTTEDCLRLSVFSPRHAVPRTTSSHKDKKKLLPVVVWIHGGGWMIGGNNVSYQLAPNWVERSQKHIVVQIQYRLNLLGMPQAAGLAEAGDDLNLFVLDQRLAVEWVRDNIAAFGGDPGRITLWGESAGGYSSDSFIYAYPKDPIVQAVISDSGNAIAMEKNVAHVSNHKIFSTAAKALGCGELPPAEELECMRKVPSSDIKKYIQGGFGEGGALDDGLMFNAFADNITIFSDYQKRIEDAGPSFPKHIPLLIGSNTNEGAAFVSAKFPNSETATKLPADLQPVADGAQAMIDCTTLREVQLRAKVGAPTYQYSYAGNWTNISPRPWLGAYHTAELPMIFGTDEIDGPSTTTERAVSRKMQDRWLQFIADPVNGLARAGWAESVSDLGVSEVVQWGTGGKVERFVKADSLGTAKCASVGIEL